MSVQPYPYDRWPRVARRSVPLIRRGARLSVGWDAENVRRELAAIVGRETTWTTGPPRVTAEDALAACLPDWPAAVALTHGTGAQMVVEVGSDLALWVLGRALRVETGDAPTPAGPLTDGERGALGYLVARLLATSGTEWRVANVLGRREGVLAVLGEGPVVIWPVNVRLAGRTHGGRCMVPACALHDGPPPAGGPHLPRRLEPLQLVLTAEAGWGRLPVSELRTMRPGDALMLDEAWWGPQGGRVRLRVAGACRATWWCTVEPDGLRMERVAPSREGATGEGRRMTHEDTTATVVDRVGDAPVEVTVEVARLTMPLEEIGRLAPGEVVLSGRAIGERVVLRAGGHALATGELVDVDGEVGVRVLELA